MTKKDVLNLQGIVYWVQIKNADNKNSKFSFVQMKQGQLERYLKNKHWIIGDVYQIETKVKKVEKRLDI